MGVYFDGMEMPKTCAECPVVIRYGANPIFADYHCGAKELPRMYSGAAHHGRHKDCPAQEITIGFDFAEEGKEQENGVDCISDRDRPAGVDRGPEG